jgi:hypothetical protein
VIHIHEKVKDKVYFSNVSDPKDWNGEIGIISGFNWIEAEPLPDGFFKRVLKKIKEKICQKEQM